MRILKSPPLALLLALFLFAFIDGAILRWWVHRGGLDSKAFIVVVIVALVATVAIIARLILYFDRPRFDLSAVPLRCPTCGAMDEYHDGRCRQGGSLK